STIEDADTGVVAYNHTILHLDGVYFTNCFVGASLIDSIPDYHFPDILSHNGALSSPSYIKYCAFDIDHIIFGLGNNLNDYKCMYLYGTQYVEIFGNTF